MAKKMTDAPMTVVETARLVTFVGANREAGEITSDTGGVRKVSWALTGRGKRGLLAAYGKNEKVNLIVAERNAMRSLIPVLVTMNTKSKPKVAAWEQGRARPDAPTRVLLAVIAKHPDAVEDVLRKAS